MSAFSISTTGSASESNLDDLQLLAQRYNRNIEMKDTTLEQELKQYPVQKIRGRNSIGVATLQILTTWQPVWTSTDEAGLWKGFSDATSNFNLHGSVATTYDGFLPGTFMDRVMIIVPISDYDALNGMATGFILCDVQTQEYSVFSFEHIEMDILKIPRILREPSTTFIVWNREHYWKLRCRFGIELPRVVMLEFLLFPRQLLLNNNVLLNHVAQLQFGKNTIKTWAAEPYSGLLDRNSYRGYLHVKILLLLVGRHYIRNNAPLIREAYATTLGAKIGYPALTTAFARALANQTTADETRWNASWSEVVELWVNTMAVRETVSKAMILTREAQRIACQLKNVTFPKESNNWITFKNTYLAKCPPRRLKVFQEMMAKASLLPLLKYMLRKRRTEYLDSLYISDKEANPTGIELWGLKFRETDVGKQFFRCGHKFTSCQYVEEKKHFQYTITPEGSISVQGLRELVFRWCQPIDSKMMKDNVNVGILTTQCRVHNFPNVVTIPSGGKIEFKLMLPAA